MKEKETVTIMINGQLKEIRKILRGGALYFDPRLLQKENFMRYLAAIILH